MYSAVQKYHSCSLQLLTSFPGFPHFDLYVFTVIVNANRRYKPGMLGNEAISAMLSHLKHFVWVEGISQYKNKKLI